MFTAAVLATPLAVIPKQQDGNPPVGTEEPCIANNCLMYAGDFDESGPSLNALWNEIASFEGQVIDGTVYTPFNVPKKYTGAKGRTDWSVTGLFANIMNYPSPSATQVTWSIVTGVSAGGDPSKATVQCSGTAPFTVTPTGRSLYGFFIELTYLVTGITTCPSLERGEYWLTVVPQVTNPPLGFEYNYLSDVEDTSPANIEGPGTEPYDESYWVSQFFGFPNFTSTNSANVCGASGCDAFSVGVIGTAVH